MGDEPGTLGLHRRWHGSLTCFLSQRGLRKVVP